MQITNLTSTILWLCHIWTWRLGDHCPHPEGMSRYAGFPRHDVAWDFTDDGEILIRGKQDHILCSGYQTADGLVPLMAAALEWFPATADLAVVLRRALALALSVGPVTVDMAVSGDPTATTTAFAKHVNSVFFELMENNGPSRVLH